MSHYLLKYHYVTARVKLYNQLEYYKIFFIVKFLSFETLKQKKWTYINLIIHLFYIILVRLKNFYNVYFAIELYIIIHVRLYNIIKVSK